MHRPPTKSSVPPPRPQPPVLPDTTSMGGVSGDACDGSALSEQRECVESEACDSRECAQFVPVEHPSPAKISQPPPLLQQPPMRQRSNTVTSNDSHSSANANRHNSPERKQVKDEQASTKPNIADNDNSSTR